MCQWSEMPPHYKQQRNNRLNVMWSYNPSSNLRWVVCSIEKKLFHHPHQLHLIVGIITCPDCDFSHRLFFPPPVLWQEATSNPKEDEKVGGHSSSLSYNMLYALPLIPATARKKTTTQQSFLFAGKLTFIEPSPLFWPILLSAVDSVIHAHLDMRY